MRIDELQMPSTKEDAETILAKGGWKIAGSGYYASVFYHDQKDYVLKLFDSDDIAYINFLKLVVSNPNPHFPKLRKGLLKVNSNYYAIRMESLHAAPKNYPVLNTYLKFKNSVPYAPILRDQYDAALEFLKTRPSLKAVLDFLIEELPSNARYDLHGENVMLRDDGTIVIIDPYQN